MHVDKVAMLKYGWVIAICNKEYMKNYTLNLDHLVHLLVHLVYV